MERRGRQCSDGLVAARPGPVVDGKWRLGEAGMENIVRWDGRPVTRPGVYSHIPLEKYHAADICDGASISSSGLRTIFSKSPAHFWARSKLRIAQFGEEIDVDEEEEKESVAFVLGRAAHFLLLGEDNFSTNFIMRPREFEGELWNGNRKMCKRWLADQAASGRTVLTPKQILAIRGMARSLAKTPLVVDTGILNGGIELSTFWRDKETGIWLKIRPDAVPFDSNDVADLKTTSKGSEDIDRTIFFDWRYDMQGELIRWGAREVWKREIESFNLVFVESKSPHCVEVVTIAKVDLDEAGADLRMALKTFDYCYRTGDWFGPRGTQHDGRFAYKPPKAADHAMWRRSVLEREIAPKEGEA